MDFEIITFGTLVVGNFMKNEWLDILEVFAKRKQGSRVFDPVKFVAYTGLDGSSTIKYTR